MSKIELRVNGVSYIGWKSIKVSQSLDQLCGSFAFGASEEFPGKPENWQIYMGDTCKVLVNGKVLSTGYIEDIPIDYDDTTHDIQFNGREITCDLVDCTYEDENNKGNWLKQTVSKLIQNLCLPFDIPISIDSSVSSDLNTQLSKFTVGQGDPIIESLLKLCKHKAVLPISYGDGRLTLTRAGTNKSFDSIEFGVNAKRASLNQSDRDRFSNYTVKGQDNEDSFKSLLNITQPHGTATDERVRRYRPYTMIAEGEVNSADCFKLARYEARNRAGRSRSITYTIPGWVQSDGSLWKINSMTRVKDSFAHIDETLLISGITYSIDDTEGEIVSITLTKKEAYELLEIPIRNIKTAFDKLIEGE